MIDNMSQAEWTYSVVQVDSGCGDGVTVTIICNGKRFIVSLLPGDSQDGDSVEGNLIERYEAACDDGDADEEEAVQQEIESLIYKVGKSTFARLAPPIIRDTQSVLDLHSLLYTETILLRVATINNQVEISEQKDAQFEEDFSSQVHFDDIVLPKYSSKEIRVLETIQGQGEITRVLVNGQEMCCKSGEPFNWEAIQREYNCLWKIAQSQHSSSIRTPKLTGLVISADNGQIVGILEEYIPTNQDLHTLCDVDVAVVSSLRRQKWASQIYEMVDLLHNIGVVWGDSKPRNILIHKETDDAWLIDFGGSWTDGWVDKELMETPAGDKQAVKRILKFLEIE
jgi:hypothetical protein